MSAPLCGRGGGNIGTLGLFCQAPRLSCPRRRAPMNTGGARRAATVFLAPRLREDDRLSGGVLGWRLREDGGGGKGMAIFFTGDTHFGDPRGLRIDRRPFAS